MADESEVQLLAEFRTVLAYAAETNDYKRLLELAQHASQDTGISHSVRLSIECDFQALASRSRLVAKSVPIWDDLARRAESLLPADDPTLMSIRSMHAQYVRRRGEPGDAERGVRMYRDELELRAEHLGDDHPRTCVARTNLALALRERGGSGDVDQALRILQEETLRRLDRYGAGHPFTWRAQIVFAQTMVRAAERAEDERERESHAREALALAHSLLEARRRRYGGSDKSTLNARLVHAQALLVLGETAEAVAELRDVRRIPRRPGMEPGWPELLLARALAPAEPDKALKYAREALALRRRYYPAGSRQVLEAWRLVQDLDDTS
ncbi:hypothetical protein E1264_32465 [Actinomadura sp. KC216]|uniref:hypothetical protein n=1 Tax=Actinomadura sp. KC216 TaxID=2530370 RepID=UPI0010518622|nr:hypothetical protein [Actinomadura sp. KC216]TDB81654.1 hypothetical protein E1264_32465 [Actinomadura sp. KC216]